MYRYSNSIGKVLKIRNKQMGKTSINFIKTTIQSTSTFTIQNSLNSRQTLLNLKPINSIQKIEEKSKNESKNKRNNNNNNNNNNSTSNQLLTSISSSSISLLVMKGLMDLFSLNLDDGT
eukprot:TRINITY_DN1106_c2_g1_i1.p1 TRINITY_DN1106_c2_g1~~TRINITY_DN1106_c2_g1_i1.p1  ORF type:complete len:119 (-),score=39.18 TRINITY_DN1106_c2_g1_i1:33-389(-)